MIQKVDDNGLRAFASAKHLNYLFFDYQGRIGRQEFALGSIILFIAVAITLSVVFLMNKLIGHAIEFPVFLNVLISALTFFVTPFFIVLHIFLQVKRIHDLNFSGWWLLISCALLPVYFVVLICLFSLAGTKEKNNYGVPSIH